MTISIGYILGHLCEFLLFIYFANTSFYPRKKYINSSLISLCGYIILFGIGLIGKAPVSILLFFIINVILLIYCYSVKAKSAMFYSLVLDMLSVSGEYIIMYILGIKYSTLWLTITLNQAIAMSIGGKLIYLIGLILLKQFINKNIMCKNETHIILTFVPLLTIICLTLIIKNDMDNTLFLWICAAFLLMNFIIFYFNLRINEKNIRLKVLQEEYNQNKAELSEYQVLAEKYEQTKIMRHDFHKQLDVLKQLIATDNGQVKEYMQQIQFSQRELNYAQYTDNRIFNILLAQKVKECHKHGIEIHIHSKAPMLSFISDIDTVAIFSNMLDNAIEASENSEKKEIYVDLYTVNNVFSAVRIENYTAKEPVILDGVLRTQKKNSDIHGIGIKSINSALKKYDSELTWSYDKDKRFFRAVALIHIREKNSV